VPGIVFATSYWPKLVLERLPIPKFTQSREPYLFSDFPKLSQDVVIEDFI
jgi:hypothetical protein